MKLPCKKRYIVGVIVIIFLLWKCTSNDDAEQQAQARAQQAADDARYAANQEAQANNQQQPYIPTPVQQPVIIQQDNHDHFWDYMMLHHLWSHESQPVYQPRYQPRPVVHNTTIINHVAPRQTPVKQPSSKWTQPSTTARSYTVSAPAASSMKTRTWSTSSSKGWGSSTSYRPRSTSYSYHTSFHSSFHGRR
jgi:hypothetical protein